MRLVPRPMDAGGPGQVRRPSFDSPPLPDGVEPPGRQPRRRLSWGKPPRRDRGHDRTTWASWPGRLRCIPTLWDRGPTASPEAPW